MNFRAKIMRVRDGERRTQIILSVAKKDKADDFIQAWPVGATAILELQEVIAKQVDPVVVPAEARPEGSEAQYAGV